MCSAPLQSSRLLQLLSPDFDLTLDLKGLAAYFRYLYVSAPRSIFRHVQQLLPGHALGTCSRRR